MKLFKLSLAVAVIVSGLYAADEVSEIGVSANVAMTSNYVWRGMSQTQDSPAIQGGFDVDYKGFYLGTWASNVNFGDATNSLEADVYLGYAGEISGLSYDIGFNEYMYPNQEDAYNFGEAYFGLGYDFGVASVGATYYIGIDTHNTDNASDWEPENAWELTVSAPIPMDMSVDVVYGDYDSLGGYYLVGLNKSYSKFDFTVAYTANDGAGVTANEQDNFVATIATSF